MKDVMVAKPHGLSPSVGADDQSSLEGVLMAARAKIRQFVFVVIREAIQFHRV
jgi:hypothetical protein